MPTSATFAYRDGANALSVIFGRSVIGVIVLVFFISVTDRNYGLTLTNMRRSFVAGVTHVFAAIGILASIVYIDISLANIILFLYPFPIAVVAHFRGETPLKPITIGLMVLAIIGLALVLGVEFSNTDPRGIAIAAMGTVAFTFMIISMADLTQDVGAPRSNLLMTLWAAIVFGLVAIVGPLLNVTDPPKIPESLFGWGAVAAVGITFSLGYLCFFVSARIIGTARASLLSTSEPIMIILFAVALVGETLSPIQWVGIAIVIGSLTMTEFTRA